MAVFLDVLATLNLYIPTLSCGWELHTLSYKDFKPSTMYLNLNDTVNFEYYFEEIKQW